MTHSDDQSGYHRSEWRKISQDLTGREIVYFISGSPDGVRETKIKSFMHDVFRFSFSGSIEPHLEKIEKDGLISKETTRSGARIWHANHDKVIEMVTNELDEMKYREKELRELHAFLINTYGD
ncbi:hypothetical protein [Methanospirillum lacunae]|uniref:ArsR family transcriptional regulator n=1 Tax=Methanospirillum lacunae TaxID=668570 RepID=A0A2V2N8L4_9EURY|nr:hypothetical protein [Methanospirillum lacunae]PWR74016.1 hypothetical protein DK846_02300 [Methanospirillum lacunae]